MVSNSLDMDPEELLATLERLRVEHADDAEYQQFRSGLPSGWPL
jgi:hypothetical protein